ncbi:hypothetical protein [Hydrogenophaga sp.]|uniref:hypothetical protein n=1 Tax=Hydrogenophaga sp. TaxID=1904254 RepID=UPI002FC5FA33
MFTTIKPCHRPPAAQCATAPGSASGGGPAPGATGELADIGNEGMVGIELRLGGGSMRNRASVVSPGGALRLPAGLLQDEMAGAGP